MAPTLSAIPVATAAILSTTPTVAEWMASAMVGCGMGRKEWAGGVSTAERWAERGSGNGKGREGKESQREENGTSVRGTAAQRVEK